MSWIILIIAGFFEAGFTTCLGKARGTHGNTLFMWMAGFFICLAISMYLLYKASQTLSMGTAYAVWTSIGAVVTLLVGIIVFSEPATAWRLFFITTLICSVIGLKIVSPG